MARTIRWSLIAADDLEHAAAYFERTSPAYAATFVQAVFAAVRALPKFPERYAIVEELRDESVRQDFVDGYRLIFEIRGEAIYILGLIHARRDFESAWNNPQRSPK